MSLRNLSALFRPKSIAVIGASPRPDSVGGLVLRNLLQGEAYAPQRFAISITDPNIPAECDIIVINGLGLAGSSPQSDLHSEEIRALQGFVDRGGRLLVMLDPWVKTNAGLGAMEQLRPWLEKTFGIAAGERSAARSK